MGWLKKLFEGTPKTPPHVMTMLLREPVKLDKTMAVAAAERGWNRPFPGGESFWFVVQVIPNVVTVQANNDNLTLLFTDFFEGDPDESTDDLPPIRERNLWPPHKGRLKVDYVITDPAKSARGRGALARMVLGLMTENCVGVFDGFSRTFSLITPEFLSELERLTLANPVED